MKLSAYLMRITLLASLLFILTACASSKVSVKNPSDYREGAQLAETMAKQDTLEKTCPTGSLVYRNDLYRDLNHHLESLKGQHSDSFVQGFTTQYKQFYTEYLNLYCDY